MDRVRLTLLLGILVLKTLAGHEGSLSCPALRPCTIALASHNPITLRCEDRPEDADVYWQYLDLSQPHARALTFIQSSGPIPQDEDLNSQEQSKVLDLMSRCKILPGGLQLLSPRVQDTGVYTCRVEGKYLAYYEINFQDSEKIYISHASLGQRVRPSANIDLGEVGTAEVFTLWSHWQPCDRCGMVGERKKLGFCYTQITRRSAVIQGPRPCGLSQSNLSRFQFNRAPELRLEMCNGTCTEVVSAEDEDTTIVLDDYRTYLHADALFTCPMSSIYKPVYWEHGNTSITRLQQLMGTAWYILDNTTGGGSLFIPILNKSEEGFYKCFVAHRLTGRFHVMFPNFSYTSTPQHYSVAESTVIGLFLFLSVLFLLSVLQSCKETTHRGIH